ncbi:MAG: hypothetical protein GY830_03310 [Bacteroidetes bacterium]|nr:hypothetical protein [Bacteroidota bacterium]
MNYATPQLINFIVTTLLGIFVFLSNRKNPLNKIFVFHNFSLAAWAFCFYQMVTSTSYSEALTWAKFLHYGAAIMPVFVLHFVSIILNLNNKVLIRVSYAIVLIIFIFIPTNLFVSSALSAIGGFKYFVGPAGIKYHFFTIFFAYLIIYSLYKLFQSLFFLSGAIKNKIKYLALGIFVLYFTGMTAFLPLFNIPTHPLFFYGVSFYVLIITYAIITRNLMDMNLAWRKILRGVLFFIIKISLLGVLFFLLTKLHIVSLFTNFIISASFLIIMDSFYSTKLLKVIDGLILHRYKKIWNKLEKIVKSKNNKYALADIVKVVVEDVSSVLNIRESKYYCLIQGKYLSFFDQNEESGVELISKILIDYLNKYKQFIYTHYLPADKEELKEYLESESIELCYPIFISDSLVGIVTYSNKKDHSMYHSEDLELVLDIIKNIESQISFLTHTENKVLNDYNLKHQNQVLSALKCLSEALDIDELHTQIVALINRYLSSEYTAIYLYDKDYTVPH